MKMRKKTRLILIVLLALVSIAAGLSGYIIKDKVTTESVDDIVLDYVLTPEIYSQFYLNENQIYKEIYVDDTEVVINKLLHHIYSKVQFKLESQNAEMIELNVTQYEKLETYFGEENHLLWVRKSESRTENVIGRKQISYSDENEFSPEVFKTFLKDAAESLELRPKAMIQVIWDVKGTVAKGDKILIIDQTYILPIPVYEDMFILDKEQWKPFKDEVLTEKIVKTPYNPLIFKSLYGCSLLLLLVVLGMILVVKVAPEGSEFEKQKKRIFNDYGDRLAELEHSLYSGVSNMISVVKIEDLVKISDEIRQPIFYFELNSESEKQIEFFVFDEGRTYHVVYYDAIDMTIENFVNIAV